MLHTAAHLQRNLGHLPDLVFVVPFASELNVRLSKAWFKQRNFAFDPMPVSGYFCKDTTPVCSPNRAGPTSLLNHVPKSANASTSQIVRHPGIVLNEPIGALVHLRSSPPGPSGTRSSGPTRLPPHKLRGHARLG